jgi:hypothetical protein
MSEACWQFFFRSTSVALKEDESENKLFWFGGQENEKRNEGITEQKMNVPDRRDAQ